MCPVCSKASVAGVDLARGRIGGNEVREERRGLSMVPVR